MNEIIELKNDIHFIVVEEFPNSRYVTTEELNHKNIWPCLKKVKKEKKLFLEIDIKEVEDIQIILKNIVKIYHYCEDHSIAIGNLEQGNIVLGYLIKMEQKMDKFEQIKELLYILSTNDIRQEYSYIYDKACDELDDIFNKNHYCDFKGDSCIKQRECKSRNTTMGCCYSFYYRKFDKMPVTTGRCQYLSERGCTIKCLCCKLFTCQYLRKQGISFSCKDFPLLAAFLNKKQQEYTVSLSFFQPKEETIKNWIIMK